MIIEPDELIDFLEMAQRATAGVLQLGNSSLQQVVVELCSEQPELAEDIYELLLNQTNKDVQIFIASVLEGLADHDYEKAFDRAVRLTNSDDVGRVRVGTVALGVLAVRQEAEEKQQSQVWNRLAELRQHSAEIVGEAVVLAYRQFWKLDEDEAIERIEELSHRNQPRIQGQILRILRMEDERNGEDWYRCMLSNLALVDSQYTGLTSDLDLLLMSLTDDDPNFVCSFLRSWVKQNPDNSKQFSVNNVLESTVGKLCRDVSEVLEAHIARWFADEDPNVQQAAADIVQGARYRERKWRLSKEVIDEMGTSDLRFLVSKVAGRITWGPAQARLLMSVLRREPEEEELTVLIQEIMANYVGYNFPGATEDLLEELKEEGNEVQRGVAVKVTQSMEDYFSRFRERPDLAEFCPPSPRVELFRRTQQKQFKVMQDMVNQKSPIFELFRNVQVRAGSGTYMSATESSERIPFSHFSTTQERDRGGLIDPVGQSLQRLRWLSYEQSSAEDAGSSNYRQASRNE